MGNLIDAVSPHAKPRLWVVVVRRWAMAHCSIVLVCEDDVAWVGNREKVVECVGIVHEAVQVFLDTVVCSGDG